MAQDDTSKTANITDTIFDFPLDFCMGLTSYNSAALMRCL